MEVDNDDDGDDDDNNDDDDDNNNNNSNNNNNNNNNVPIHAMNVCRGVQKWIHSFLTSALNVWLASCSGHFTS